MVDQFFDRAMYYAVRGHERVREARLGGVEASKGWPWSVTERGFNFREVVFSDGVASRISEEVDDGGCGGARGGERHARLCARQRGVSSGTAGGADAPLRGSFATSR